MKQRTKSDYAGVLANRIKLPVKNYLAFAALEELEPAEIAAHNEREQADFLAEERIKKLPHLFLHFGLKVPASKPAWTPWHELLLRLAIEHVPGFQIAKKRGRRKNMGLDWDLYARVRLLEIERNLTAAAACNFLARRSKNTNGGKPLSANTLRRRYMAAKPKAASILAKAAAYE